MRTPTTAISAGQLLRMPEDCVRYELAKGALVEMLPAGARHGRIASRIDRRLGRYVEENALGEMFTADAGFVLSRDPDTVRAPDVAFVSADRLPEGELSSRFLELAPDLAVEVISPSDTADQVQAKLVQWIDHGVRLVWLVYPATGSLAAYRALDDGRLLTEQDVFSGEPVLPGFSCPVSDLF
jgi:Uma2 family endonuclease